ncbi:Metal dependent phosphohydrolase, HD region [Lentisphaera araneosa HTCC2155]|uniref:Metal dependent phosphohydrolase, HD region n=1 Tax=Lentisphaera araneosa HTCC2155 TaxID=313628 RepID=A6DSB5_9BACT|nr:HD domain-containing protein [Lentisphaera araneosa]EDM25460.1 Metal dependent phosphohydrolase, HD region [Lentisphaera araneosa HTCC2155]
MSINLVELAEKVAREAHQGQYRRGGVVPYIEHPKAVVSRVGNDVDAQVVAWLHDVIEDCEMTAEDLLDKGFSEIQVNAVELLSKTRETVYTEYLEAISQSPLATKVKIADMISNLADIPTKKQIKKYAKALLRLSKEL